MPIFTRYNVDVDATVNVGIDVKIDEFLEELTDPEIEKVIEWLSDNGHIKSTDLFSTYSLVDEEYMSMIDKLNDPLIGSRLSLEDLEKIKRIVNKL